MSGGGGIIGDDGSLSEPVRANTTATALMTTATALIAISATFLLILQDLGLATTSTCAGPSCRATLADICLSRGTDGTPFAVEGASSEYLVNIV